MSEPALQTTHRTTKTGGERQTIMLLCHIIYLMGKRYLCRSVCWTVVGRELSGVFHSKCCAAHVWRRKILTAPTGVKVQNVSSRGAMQSRCHHTSPRRCRRRLRGSVRSTCIWCAIARYGWCRSTSSLTRTWVRTIRHTHSHTRTMPDTCVHNSIDHMFHTLVRVCANVSQMNTVDYTLPGPN